MARRRGFTLIELLVVIAIIGILAAMLFPVFARAREAARKIQCLANVKNIAMAIQMYLVDWDRFPPREHRQEIIEFYMEVADEDTVTDCVWEAATKNNPYLKWPVILDEYIKNRDIWRCPSAKYVRDIPVLDPFATTAGGNAAHDWFAVVQERYAAYGDSCSAFMQCGSPFPRGWGGSTTDSFLQQQCGGTGAIELGYNGLNDNLDLSTSQITDPARWLAAVELAGNDSWSTFILAYPDLCTLGCATLDRKYNIGDCVDLADWVNCSWSRDCGAGDPLMGEDVQRRKPWARHLGGVNMGFSDGHAQWMNSEAVLSGGHDYRWFIPDSQKQADTALKIVGPVGLCMMPDY
jgi:prepilin-type N-terminal cleavage/methylation domain-containing protein/prepilin-type processing-associated H-X9-DG protein